jgi:hypothetical protein
MDGQTDNLPVKRGRGRPPLLITRPEIKEQIIEAIKDGMYIDRAFQLVGISPDNYWGWAEYAAAGREPFCQFFLSVKKAEAEAERAAIIDMRRVKGAFLPEATFLERRFRDRWGRSDRHQIDATVQMRVEVVNFAKHK